MTTTRPPNLYSTAQIISQTDPNQADVFLQYQSALIAQNYPLAFKLFTEHPHILQSLKCHSGSTTAETLANFKTLLDYFELILGSNYSLMIEAIWDDNLLLQSWYQGNVINFSKENEQPYSLCIKDAQVIDMIKSVLKIGQAGLIKKFLGGNTHALNFFTHLPFNDLESILMSLRIIKISDVNTQLIICDCINMVTNHLVLQCVITRCNLLLGVNSVDDTIINRFATLVSPVVTNSNFENNQNPNTQFFDEVPSYNHENRSRIEHSYLNSDLENNQNPIWNESSYLSSYSNSELKNQDLNSRASGVLQNRHTVYNKRSYSELTFISKNDNKRRKLDIVSDAQVQSKTNNILLYGPASVALSQSVIGNNDNLPDKLIEIINSHFPTIGDLTQSTARDKVSITKSFKVSKESFSDLKLYAEHLKNLGIEIPEKCNNYTNGVKINIINLSLYESALTKYKRVAQQSIEMKTVI